jgi:hypothetical protein
VDLNPCYYSVQTILSSGLINKNLKVKIYKKTITVWMGSSREMKRREKYFVQRKIEYMH